MLSPQATRLAPFDAELQLKIKRCEVPGHGERGGEGGMQVFGSSPMLRYVVNSNNNMISSIR